MAPPRGRGRPRGVQNKITTTVKRAIEATYDGIGGLDAFIAWANSNPTEFYRLWAKLLPLQVQAELNHTGAIQIVVETGISRSPDGPLGNYGHEALPC